LDGEKTFFCDPLFLLGWMFSTYLIRFLPQFSQACAQKQFDEFITGKKFSWT
jgi:hypothetical protein